MNAFRQLLEAGDVANLRRMWHVVAPDFPQPETYQDAEMAMHYARTTSDSVSRPLRLWSHCWLEDHGYPSGLPEDMRADATETRVVDAVGISVGFSAPELRPAAQEIQMAMSFAVEDAYAEGRKDPEFVQARMKEARAVTTRKLFGR